MITKHVHLLVTHGFRADQPGVQALGRRYVRYINDRYRRTAFLVENDCLLRCYRYIELNPAVRSRCRPGGVPMV